MNVTLIQSTPDPVKTIAQIASICYDSEPNNPIRLVERLYKNGHHSVFEHIYFTFRITGISRACSHQLVRHRFCSFTQRSQRYCSEDGFLFVEPQNIENNEECVFEDAMSDALKAYLNLIAHGVSKEDARFVLPNACATDLYLSCNLRELIHIANERLCKRAQWEIRNVVRQMMSVVPTELQFMLVPKCESGLYVCKSVCIE